MSRRTLRLVASIARHQLRSLFQQPAMVGVLVVTLLSGLCALAVNWRSQVDAERVRIGAQENQRRLWEHLDVHSGHSAAHVGQLIFRPLPPVSVIDSGLMPFSGMAMVLRAHSGGEAAGSPVQDARLVPREGFFSLAVILQVLLPLLLAVCISPVLVEERLSGVARLLIVQGVPRPVWLTGSVLGRAIPAFALLAFFVALSELSILIGFGMDAAWHSLPRVLLLSLDYVAMLLAYAFLFGAISLRAKTLRASMVISLCACSWCTVIAPPMMQGITEQLHPLPTRLELEERSHRDMAPLDGENFFRRRKQIIAELMQKYHAKTEKELPVDAGGFLLEEYEALGAHVNAMRSDEVYGALRVQMRVTEWLGILDLRSVMQTLSMQLAGTGVEDMHRFDVQAEAYRYEMVRKLNEDQKLNAPGKSYAELVKLFAQRREELFRSIPPFVYRSSPMRNSLRETLPAMVVLLLWLVVSTLALVYSARRTAKEGL